jgi:hydrogenase-4 component B
LINLFIAIVVLAILIILFVNTKAKGIVALAAVLTVSLISSIIAVKALRGCSFELLLSGTIPFGAVLIKIDALSGWFLLTINFTFITGAIYGLGYMKQYIEQKSNITMHCIAFILVHAALVTICSVQNGMVFLVAWEIMALSAFVLVIFEHNKQSTLRAGINYLVQSHISIVFIMLGFIYVAFKTNSYNFKAIADFSSQQSTLAGTVLFLCFFIGFAIKAGFVPFHTWLPYAHPAAPAHISGIMSGVIIKIGIYGILRMLLLIKADYTTIGYIILFVSVVSGIYGVMLAIIQHNLKRLLAYHSIENIGIIGIGIGIGCIGLGSNNKWLAILGFSGALLHTLNHSLFKSLLFFGAGNVYQSTHTMSIERLGGIIKKMPHTALLFLIASLAICGVPPLNGFVSEFLIYGGLYNWLFNAGLVSLIINIFSIFGLVLIGGLAIFCFTKAFSIVFLGQSRSNLEHAHEISFWQLLPMWIIVAVMIFIGLYPSLVISFLQRPVNLFTHETVLNFNLMHVGAIDSLQMITWYSAGLIVLILAIAGLKKLVSRKRKIVIATTWDCGFGATTHKIQYTANSYARTYTKLIKPVLDIEKKEVEISEVFPARTHFETHPYDKIERIFVDKPLKLIKIITSSFLFLNNGRLQQYILYGIIFIASILCIPLLIEKLMIFLKFLNHL